MPCPALWISQKEIISTTSSALSPSQHTAEKVAHVVHGVRHAPGLHAIFADADYASRFSDVGALIAGAQRYFGSEWERGDCEKQSASCGQ